MGIIDQINNTAKDSKLAPGETELMTFLEKDVWGSKNTGSKTKLRGGIKIYYVDDGIIGWRGRYGNGGGIAGRRGFCAMAGITDEEFDKLIERLRTEKEIMI